MDTQSFLPVLVGNSSMLATVAEIVQKLGSLQSEAEIFQAAVEIVTKTLNCDRAVVYSLQTQSYGKVLAEVVTPGYAQLLGQVIHDSCFDSGYFEQYQKGRVKAVEDIANSELSPCHVDNLQKIQVKANAIVSLVDSNDSLLGLLIVHQCRTTRQWQPSEIEFLLSTANWIVNKIAESKAVDKMQSQIESMQLGEEQIACITQLLHRGELSEDVLQIAVERAKELINCDRVVAYSLEDANIGEIVAEATLPSLAPTLGKIISDPCLGHTYREKYQDGRVRAMNNIYKAGMTPCYIENLEKIAVKSSIVVPINFDSGKIYGLLVAHQCFQFRDWQSNEIESLEKIAVQTGLALSKTKLKEKMLSVNADLAQLDNTRDRLTIAKMQLQEIKSPLANTQDVLAEVRNLNNLIERELNLINQNGTPQTKKDLKLVQLFARKLTSNISRLQLALESFRDRKDSVEAIVQDLVSSFYRKD